ncbi:hypothetical protein BS78_K154000 [Paspalum vaginatum]|uniref:Rx N-terminal domain-containing protein n=1 Tax=Paspalum vaginatum TaxID=158149 RepID=A0A9W7XBZ1_9POAL|nr:hypothetical protein BS78_K154000 [Paspalum vaginatum]
MDMVGGSAQSAVDSLLGRLSSVFVEEAQLLRSVHDDMQFIKREMESMNGFLLDAGDEDRGNGNQVRVWRRQVHELAYDSQSCVDRYVQTFGATHPAAGAGLLASVRRVPVLVRTLPSRHRIATEIRVVKARALEVGERRQRYGVVTLGAQGGGASTPAAAAARRAATANREAEDARRRHSLDSADVLFDANARARELVAWLMGAPQPVPRGRLRRNQLVTAGQLIQKMWSGSGGANDSQDLKMELMKLFRGTDVNDNPENVAEAAGFLSSAMLEVDTQEVKVISSWLLDMVLGRADMPQQDPENKGGSAGHELLMDVVKAVKDPLTKFIDHAEDLSFTSLLSAMSDLIDIFKALKEPIEKFLGIAEQPQQDSSESEDDGSQQARSRRPAATSKEDLLEMVKAAKEPMEVARAEARYVAAQIKWLLQMFCSEKFSFNQEHVQHPKVVTIVTPPVQDFSSDDGPAEELLEETHAPELARKVFDHPRASDHFNTRVWVDAKLNSKLKPRLKSILHQVSLPSDSPASPPNLEPTEEEASKWKHLSVEELKAMVAERLEGKRFLMVLADPEDDNAWQDITSALPNKHGESAVIETPRIKYMAQFHAWYRASWIFWLMGASSRYQVHFCSNLVGMRKVAAELVGSDQLPGGVSAILKKCLWDNFATKMFLHALYANPHRSDAELERLMLGLRYSSSVSNARRMVQFCYEDLPRQYQSCLLSLSVFPQEDRTFKRTSLVRRWAAESFVSARDGLAAVDEADRCFDALIARGLLQPADIGPAGKVKSCTMHRHVHSFTTKMASYQTVVDNTDLRSELAHRLSTRSGILQLLLENQAAADSNTCWGIIHRHRHAPSGDFPREVVTLLNLLPASSDQLGLVKLLDLEGCKGLKKRHFKKICNKIFQLKYLSLRDTDATELPKEINKLRYLETLDIRQTRIKSFPAKTIALPKLMHLLAGCIDHESTQVIESDRPFSTVHLPSHVGSLTNMQVLSHVEVSETESDTSELTNVGRKLHLRKLGVVIRGKGPLGVLLRVISMLHESLCSLSVHLEPMKMAEGEVYSMEPQGGDAFDIPKSLESLNIKGVINELPTWIRQLHRLSKITLCRTNLREGDIKKLGELANLRCIRLWYQSYTDKKLTFNPREFRRLELLVIEDSGISDIHFAKNAAPTLKKIICNFTGAEVTLSGIQELLNLKEIHVSGNCDESHLSKIKEDIKKNPNLPDLYP